MSKQVHLNQRNGFPCRCEECENARRHAIPVGSFGYCPICYHPFDQCSHCDADATAVMDEGRRERLLKLKQDYFGSAPQDISQLAADAMIVVIDLETELRGRK